MQRDAYRPAYYREQASEMLRQAQMAPDDATRSTYFELAASWTELARVTEGPGRWRRPARP